MDYFALHKQQMSFTFFAIELLGIAKGVTYDIHPRYSDVIINGKGCICELFNR
jgi:hypothetical protein